MQAAAPERIKHTMPPPDVCDGCYWYYRYLDALELVKKLRRELLTKRAAKVARARPEPKAPEENKPNYDDPEVSDLVDRFRQLEGD